MKKFRASAILMLAIGLLMYGCNPDGVAPKEGGNGNPSLAGSMGDPHPALDTICQRADTMFLIREDDGSEYVNKCFGPAGPITCAPGQMKWGYMEMVEGYFGDTSFVDCNFTMAPGWYCDFNNWEIGIGTEFQFDQNGIPVVDQDWGNLIVNPVQNKWQLRIAGGTLPNGFDVALRVSAVRLNLFGAVTTGSNTMLWGKNRQWNVTASNAASNSPWLMHFDMLRCLTTTPPPPVVDTTHICEVVYTGLTCTGNNLNSTVLHPTATETSGVTYQWGHNGATTQDVTVSPTTTTSYAATIKVDGVVKHVVIFDVNVIDVSCTISGGGNGGGGYGNGGGNGGGGCGNGGSGSGSQSGNGSGGSGSSHHPGCNHNHSSNSNCNGGNHRYGCNTSHSGGNTNCNHRGHGYHCTTTHASNRACNGGHSRGCDGQHSSNQTCQTRGGHRYNCNGQHTTGNCNSSLSHTQGCNSNNHNSYRGCNNGHSHNSNGHGNGSGNGSGHNGGHGSSHNGGSCNGHNGSGNGSNGGGNNSGGGNTVQGVKVCHVPPGNPGGASTVCVTYSQLSQHVTGVCSSNGGGNGGGGYGGYGNGGSGSGSGSGNGSNGHGGNGHGCGGHSNNCNGHHQGGGCNNGHSGSGHSGSGSNSHGFGSHHGGGCQGNGGGGHTGDMIGACNSNPCL